MSITPPGFLYASTTTIGKENVVEWQINQITRHLDISKFTGYGVCLVGKPDQLSRHRNEMIKSGIPEHKQIMVDWTYSIYLGLLEEADNINFKGQIVCGDIVDVVRKLWANGEQVDVIDFDDICLLKDYHINLLRDAMINDVKVFICVLTTRGNASGIGECLEYYQIVCDHPKEWSNKHKKYIDPIGKITEAAFDWTVSGHDYTFKPKRYQGRGNCPMISLLVMKD